MKSIPVFLAVMSVAGAPAALGCDLCSIYQASGGGTYGFYSGLAEQYSSITTLDTFGTKVPNADQEFIRSSISQLFAGYAFNSRLSLQLNVPIIYREFGWTVPAGTAPADGTSVNSARGGLGDVSLVGNYQFYRLARENITLSANVMAGVKLPTGDDSLLNPNHPMYGAAYPLGIGNHDITLGSGSVDGVVGASFNARWKRMLLNAGAQYSIRSEGGFGHQYANDLTWSGGPGVYLALNHNYTLSLQAVVSGEYKGADTWSGVQDPDSAETMVYVGPQINFTWGGRVSATLGADLPVSEYVSQTQAAPDFRVRAAFTFRF